MAARLRQRAWIGKERQRRSGGAVPEKIPEPEAGDARDKAAERKRRSRQMKAEGCRVIRKGFPIDTQTLSALVLAGLIDLKATESGTDTVDAISALLDQFAELDRETLEWIRIAILNNVTV